MILVMKQNSTDSDIKNITNTIHDLNLEAHISKGESLTIIGVVGDKSKFLEKNPQLLPGVERVVLISESYKLANKKFKPEPTIIDVRGVKIGGNNFVIMAGPCAVESKEQLLESAMAAKAAGAQILRGGAYKPRTSPYAHRN